MNVDEKELHLFLEVDDLEMQDITVMVNAEGQKLKEKKVAGGDTPAVDINVITTFMNHLMHSTELSSL